MAKKVTKVELVNFLRWKLMTDPVWAKAALVRIFENQTDDEQVSKETIHCNMIGFTASDARILTSFAKFYKAHDFLSEKQTKWLMPKMGKYAGQLAKQDYFSWEKLEVAYLKNVA